MIRREKGRRVSNRFGGKGEIELYPVLNEEDLMGKGEVMLRMVLPPGSSIGYHQHLGNFEVYYILSGEGIFQDQEEEKPIQAGEAGLIRPGQYHGLVNTGSRDMVVVALVLYA